MIQQTLEKLRQNLVQMQPDQLVQYLQNPTPGGPPQYLVLAALKEQDAMRNSAPQQPPQSTVAQQEMAKAEPQAPASLQMSQMPQQGLGALPMESAPQAPEMPPQMQAGGYVHDYGVATLPYSPNYEEGGIVSFAGPTDGSLVGGSGQFGGYFPSNYNVYDDPNSRYYIKRRTPEELQDIEDFRAQFLMSQRPENKELFSEDERKAIGSRELRRAESPPESPIVNAVARLFTPNSSKKTEEDLSKAISPNRNIAQEPYFYDYSKKGEKPNLTSEEIKDLESRGIDPTQYLSSGPRMQFSDVPNETAYLEKNLIAPEKYNMETRMGERAEMLKQFGVDPDFYKKQKAENEKGLAELKANKKKDAWLAAASGFLKMAQTPGSIGQALAAGAESGLGALKDVNKEFKEDERMLKQEQKQLDMAEYAAKRGDAESELKYKDTAKEARRNFLNAKTQALLEQRMKEFEIKNGREMKMAEMAQARDLARAEIGANYHIAELKLKGAMDEKQATITKEIIKARAAGMPTGDTFAKIHAKYMELLGDDMALAQAVNQDVSAISALPSDQKELLRAKTAKARAFESFQFANQAWQLQQAQNSAYTSGILAGGDYKTEEEE